MNRRSFLKSATIATGVTVLSQQEFSVSAQLEEHSGSLADTIGLQLWTVRDQLAADEKKTLREIAQAGFNQVELMDTAQAKSLLPICRDLGLNVTSSFLDWEAICGPKSETANPLLNILETANRDNLKYLVFGYIGKGHRESIDQFKRHAEAANTFGEKCSEAGIKLCYHNHAFEFEKLVDKENPTGMTGFDVFMDELESDFCTFELDVFWAAIAGWDPIDTLMKLKGRVSQVHLKDLRARVPIIYDESKVPDDAFEELGDGTINIGDVVRVCSEIGVEQCHVEQDESPNPLASIRQSIKYFRSL